VSGHDFSRAANKFNSTWAGRDGFEPTHLSPEKFCSRFLDSNRGFSAASFAVALQASEKLLWSRCFETARLYSLLKNSSCGAVLKGHGFSRAASSSK
jgi:hypothetical protein